MAAILIVGDDTVIAQHWAQTLRRLGHKAILAPDVRAARLEMTPPPGVILLDMSVPDPPGAAFLRYLGRRPETARIPVLVVSGRADATTRLRVEIGTRRIACLRKPLADHQLDQAVTAALAPVDEDRRRDIIQHMIATGPHRLAAQVYRRVAADRVAGLDVARSSALTWPEIGRWALSAGVLDREQAVLLGCSPQDSSH